MSGNDAGNDHLAVESDDFRFITDQLPDLLVAANGQDATIANRHRRNNSMLGVHRQNLAADQHGIGGDSRLSEDDDRRGESEGDGNAGTRLMNKE